MKPGGHDFASRDHPQHINPKVFNEIQPRSLKSKSLQRAFEKLPFVFSGVLAFQTKHTNIFKIR